MRRNLLVREPSGVTLPLVAGGTVTFGGASNDRRGTSSGAEGLRSVSAMKKTLDHC